MALSSEIAGTIEEDEQVFDKKLGVSQQGLKEQDKVDLTLSQRMLSACTGSLLTSLVVTPFDVVRIRLQQQELFNPSQLPQDCCRKVFWETTSNVSTLEGACIRPQACTQEGKITGTFQGLSKIAKQEGLCTLYRGLTLTLLMAIPSNVVYFSGYEFLRDSSPLKESFPVLNPLLCGSFARILAATTVAPLELIKTRIQAVPSNSSASNLSSNSVFKMVLQNSIKEIRDKGIGSIYKGLGLTLWRDVPFSGIYWTTYEFITHALRNNTFFSGGKGNEDVDNDRALFVRSFIGGSLAGMTAALFTNPFDVGKTRMQVSLEEANSLGSLGKNNAKNKETIFRYIAQIYRNEGFGALFVGLIPRCMKVAPACAIMISSYEMTKKFFRDKSL